MTNNNSEKFEVTHLSDNGSMDSITNNTITNNKYISNVYKSYYGSSNKGMTNAFSIFASIFGGVE
jgi:hypothetical protein